MAGGACRRRGRDARRRQAASGGHEGRRRPAVPAGVGHQAPHRDRGARGHRGRSRHARPARGTRGLDRAPSPGARVGPRHRRRRRRAPGRRRIYSNAGFEQVADTVSDGRHDSVRRLPDRGRGRAARHARDDPGRIAGSWRDLDGARPGAAGRRAARSLAARPAHAGSRRLPSRFPGSTASCPGSASSHRTTGASGFEIRGTKSPHWTATANSPATVGHFGRSGTFLWMDPVQGVALVCLTDLDFGPWAVRAWPALGDAVLARTSCVGGPKPDRLRSTFDSVRSQPSNLGARIGSPGLEADPGVGDRGAGSGRRGPGSGGPGRSRGWRRRCAPSRSSRSSSARCVPSPLSSTSVATRDDVDQPAGVGVGERQDPQRHLLQPLGRRAARHRAS